MKSLFKAGKIGSLRIKNRIVMAPMGTIGLVEFDGRYSQRAIDYFAARARGGVGLIVTGLTAVESEIEKRAQGPWSGLPRADSPIYISRLSELADAVHPYGTKIFAQLTAGYGRVGKGAILANQWAVAPSAQPCFWDSKSTARELTIEEVEKLANAFGPAALHVKLAGFDGVELHGHEGYLMDQFLSSQWNQRKDKYGCDFDGRLRFSEEVISGIRKYTGKDFPIIYRLSAHHGFEGGRKLEESIEIAKRLEQFGIDCLHIDAGCYDAWHWAHPPIYMPRATYINEIEAIKKEVSIPVIAVGRLGYPEIAEKVLVDEKADFIALGRPLLADPEWANKVKEKCFDEIRPCIGDHEGCLGRISLEGKYLSCTVNPQTGMEKELTIKKADKKKFILIVGGGPGGMEAARVSSLRGHRVEIWEKSMMLGGNLIPAGVPDFKADIRLFVKYLENQMKKLGVKIELNKEATLSNLIEAKADEIIIATGAKSIIPKIPGIENENVRIAIDLFNSENPKGKTFVVVGGGVVGCEVALWLRRIGKDVTVFDLLETVANDVFPANRQNLIELLENEGVNVVTKAEIKKITNEGIIYKHLNAQKEINADRVVIAVGLKPNEKLIKELEETDLSFHSIGDCIAPRKIQSAIWEAYRLANIL